MFSLTVYKYAVVINESKICSLVSKYAHLLTCTWLRFESTKSRSRDEGRYLEHPRLEGQREMAVGVTEGQWLPAYREAGVDASCRLRLLHRQESVQTYDLDLSVQND